MADSAISNGHDVEKGLHRTDTAVTMPPELFEKVRLRLSYLSR